MEILIVFGQPKLLIYSSLKGLMEIPFSLKMTNSPIILQPFPLDPVYTNTGAILAKSIFKHGSHRQAANMVL